MWNSAPMTDYNLAHNSHWLRNVSDPIVSLSGWDWPASEGASRTYLFTKQLSTVRLLGGWSTQMAHNASGGPESFDVVYRCSGNASLCYRLDLLWARLDPLIIESKITPVLVLDNVPYCFVRNSSVGTYGQNQAPDDPSEYASAIEHLIRAIVARYGEAEVRTWLWRVATEPNTYPGHWASGPEKYSIMYDWVVQAIWSVLPGAAVGPGNFCPFYLPEMGCTDTLVPVVEPIITHITEGTNNATGQSNKDFKGGNIAFLAMSFYGSYAGRRKGNENSGYDPTMGALSAAGMQLLQRDHPEQLGNKPTYFFEYGNLGDGNGRNRSGEPGSFGASWTLASSVQAIQRNVSRIFHWGNAEGLSVPGEEVHTLLQSTAWFQSAVNGLGGTAGAGVLFTPTDGKDQRMEGVEEARLRAERMLSEGGEGGARALESRVEVVTQRTGAKVRCPVASLVTTGETDRSSPQRPAIVGCSLPMLADENEPQGTFVENTANLSASGFGARLGEQEGSGMAFAVSVFNTDRTQGGTAEVNLLWECGSGQPTACDTSSSSSFSVTMQQLNSSSCPYDSVAIEGAPKGWVWPWVKDYRYGLGQMLTPAG